MAGEFTLSLSRSGNLDARIADLKSKDTTFCGNFVHGPICRMNTCEDTEGNSIILHPLNPKISGLAAAPTNCPNRFRDWKVIPVSSPKR